MHAKCGNVPSAMYLFLRDYQSPILKVQCPQCTASKAPKVSKSEADHDVMSNPTPMAPAEETLVDDLGSTVVSTIPVPPCSPPSASCTSEVVVRDTSVVNRSTRKTFSEVLSAPPNRRKRNQPARPLDPKKEIEARIQSLEKMVTERVNSGNPHTTSQRPGRERCLIIVNVPESDIEHSADRMRHDLAFLQSMVSTLFDQGEDGITVLTAFRLGKKPEDASKPRPLKVVLASEEEARRVFTRLHRLKGAPYRVLRDLSLEDRLRMRQAVQELKQRRELGEENLHIQDFRVVVRRPRVVWEPVALQPLPPSNPA